MALFDNGMKSNIFTGLAIGIGAAVLAPAVVPILARVMKPLAQALSKGRAALHEKATQTINKTGQ